MDTLSCLKSLDRTRRGETQNAMLTMILVLVNSSVNPALCVMYNPHGYFDDEFQLRQFTNREEYLY